MRVNLEAPGWYLAMSFVWLATSIRALFDHFDAMPYVLASLITATMWRVTRLEQSFRAERRERDRSDVSG